MRPAGSPPSFDERQQHAGHERLARARVVPDRERLAAAAEDHLLVGDEAGEPDGVDRHVAPASSPRSRARSRTVRRASSRGGARRSRPRRRDGTPPRRTASSAPRRSRSSGRRRPAGPPRAPHRLDLLGGPSRSCRRRTASRLRARAGCSARRPSASVKSTIASASLLGGDQLVPGLDERRAEHRADLARLGRGRSRSR